MMITACARCGSVYRVVLHDVDCVHGINCVKVMTSDHRDRLAAAYVFGKRYNPDHDETSYFEQTREPAVTRF